MRPLRALARLLLLAGLAGILAACEGAPRRGAVFHGDLPLGPWWGFRGPYAGPIALGEPRPRDEAATSGGRPARTSVKAKDARRRESGRSPANLVAP